MNRRIGTGLAAFALLALFASPLAFAERQDHDMADRIYEKYKEREQKKRGEDTSRRSGEQRERDSRSRSTSSDDQRKSQERSRSSREFNQSEARSDNRERRTNRDSDYRSSARDERSSRQSGEQLSRELQNLLNRKSERRQSSEPASRSRVSRERTVRSTSDTGSREVREKVSLDQAVNIVRRQSNGKVISARSEGSGSTRKHRIKVLIDDRRVRTYVVSAVTGKVY